MNILKLVTIFVHALIGWALCAATMGIGLATLPLQHALTIHAIGAPIFFTLVSLIYFTRFHYTTPVQTAIMFVGFVIAMDFFVVALLMNRSVEMFASLLGTWIPFALIFTATYVTGLYLGRNPHHKAAALER
jgi:hypothetical protein